MPSDQNIADTSIQKALEALQLGDRQGARSWALRAIRMAPELEEPWLILAAVSSPRASIVYLEKALEIDPLSERARKGMAWARERLDKENTQPTQRIGRVGPTHAEPPFNYPQPYPGMTEVAKPVEVPGRRKKKATRHPPRAAYKQRIGVWLITPWLIGLVLFKLVPILATLAMSFTNMNLLEPFKYKLVGFQNYIELFKDPNLGLAFLSTLKSALVLIPLQVLAAVALASLLSSQKLYFKNSVRLLFFLPSIIASYPAYLMWRGFTDPNGWLYGLFLNPLGLAGIVSFLGVDGTALTRLLAALWSIGPGFLIMIGAMQGIPPDVYEAALVDGANRLRTFFSITIPMISQAIFFTLILNLTTVFGGGVVLDIGYTFKTDTSSVDAFLYDRLFHAFRLGSSASLAWIFFIFMLALVLFLFSTSKYWVYFPDQEN